MKHEYFVYMIASKSRTLYVGVTRHLAARVGQHKDGLVPGFTADYACTRLVWFERHQYVRNAILREKQIKRWRREKKVWLIERENATWEDLAMKWWASPELASAVNGAEAGPSTSLRFGRDDKSEGTLTGAIRKLRTNESEADPPEAVIKPREWHDSPSAVLSKANVAHGPTR